MAENDAIRSGDKPKKRRVVGGDLSGAAAAKAPPGAFQAVKREVPEAITAEAVADADKVDKQNDKETKRQASVAKKVAAADLGDDGGSLASYIVAHSTKLSDAEIDKMIADFKAGNVVSHGDATWGEPRSA